MKKIWLKSYPPGVPHAATTDRFGSIPELLNDVCTVFAERPAFGNFGTLIDYSDIGRLSNGFAAWLLHEAGLTPGARVALMMPNMLAYPIALFGVLKAGGIVVNTNPQYTAAELAHQLADSGAEILVVFEQALPTVAEISSRFPQLKVVVARIGDAMPWPKAQLFNRLARRHAGTRVKTLEHAEIFIKTVESGTRLSFKPPAIKSDDLAFLQYTGGTTGGAKAAMLSHANILANIAQLNAWFLPLTAPGEEIMITALPLYHIYALTGNCLAFVAQGGLNYLITDPRNLRTFVKEIKRVRFTTISGVNTLFNALLQHRDFSSVDFSHLKFTSGGGMAVQRAVAERWQNVTGSVIAEGYGLTEASPVVAANRFDTTEFNGGIGLPVPSTEVRICDEQGTELSTGEAGELQVRGPQVMRGYWNNPPATAAVLDTEGWLKTGDIAVMSKDGSLRIVDRKKDVILVSGFNVYPNEIEDVAVTHPHISEAAAIGISDAKSGEAVRLVVVANDPALDAEAVINWCQKQLTAYKIPRSVLFVDALPKSNVGKILRREVRALYGGEQSVS